MKILEVIGSLGPTGGGETFAVNIAREFQTLATLKVVILHDNNKKYFIERLKEKGIEPVILHKKGHFDSENTKKLRQIILDFEPDVIHTENNALISTYFALRKTKFKRRIRVYHTLHLDPEKECEMFLVRALYKHIFKKQNYIPVAITKELSRQTSRYFGGIDVPFVNNGVDLTPFHSEKRLSERKYDIVVVGRFSPQKNHPFLLKVFSKLKEKAPYLKVALVGGGELFDNIKAMAKELGMDNYIDFMGVLDSPAEIVNDSKVIALGSLFEANPLSLIEGMSSGCVVVSSRVGGIADIVHDPENGFLFEMNDEAKMVELLTNILKNVKRFEVVSKFNASYAQQFSISKCAQEYIDLFLKV